MSNDKPLDNDIIKFSDNNYEEILLIKESYCMACESPLKSYNSLICHDCLDDSVDLLAEMIDISKNSKKQMFVEVLDEINLDKDIECIEKEILEEEVEDDENNNKSFDYRIKKTLKNLLSEFEEEKESL